MQENTPTQSPVAEEEEQPQRRRPYRSPRLEDLGAVEDLTRTGLSTSGVDGGQTFPNIYAES